MAKLIKFVYFNYDLNNNPQIDHRFLGSIIKRAKFEKG